MNPADLAILSLKESVDEIHVLRAENERLATELKENKASALEAFVAGAKWWQFEEHGSTMFASEIDRAAAEAERRFPFAPWVHLMELQDVALDRDRVREENERLKGRIKTQEILLGDIDRELAELKKESK